MQRRTRTTRKSPQRGLTGVMVIGTPQETVSEAEKAVLAIMVAPHADERTKRVALATMGRLCKQADSITITGCTLNAGVPVRTRGR